MPIDSKLLQDIETNDRTLTELDLSKINDEDIEALAVVLARNHTLTSVSLHSNKIDVEGTQALAMALARSHTLASFSFYRKQIGDEGVISLAKDVARNNPQVQVRLGYISIDAAGAAALATALGKSQILTLIKLNGDTPVNRIDDETIKILAPDLEKNQTLIFLDLWFNYIGPNGAKALAAALEKNHTLTHLDLGQNSICDEGAKALAAALEKNQTLTSLDLSFNGISSNGAKALAAALEKNQTLTSLDLSLNYSISSNAAKALAAALEKNHTLTSIGLSFSPPNFRWDDEHYAFNFELYRIRQKVKANLQRVKTLHDAADVIMIENDAAEYFQGYNEQLNNLCQPENFYPRKALKYLTFAKAFNNNVLRYVFSLKENVNRFAKEFFIVQHLAKLTAKPVCFISYQPAASIIKTYVFGLLYNARLLLVAPSRLSTSESYKYLEKIKNDFMLKAIYVAELDTNLVSSGPICVEMMHHFASFSPTKLSEIFYQIMALSVTDNNLEIVSKVVIDGLLPQSLKSLLSAQSYENVMIDIRLSHLNLLRNIKVEGHSDIEQVNEYLDEQCLHSNEQVFVVILQTIIR